MKKLAAIICLLVGVANAQSGYDLLTLTPFTIASNSTVVITNEYQTRGLAIAAVLYSTGAGPITAAVTTANGYGTRTMVAAHAVTSGTPAVSNLTAYAMFDEKTVLTVKSGATMTGTASVVGYVIYEK
jgi:hypothetical protein